jgi:hypothetical protein
MVVSVGWLLGEPNLRRAHVGGRNQTVGTKHEGNYGFDAWLHIVTPTQEIDFNWNNGNYLHNERLKNSVDDYDGRMNN